MTSAFEGQAMTNERKLTSKIANFIRTYETVSFLDIVELDGVSGDYAWDMMPGLVLWDGLSEQAISALNELLDAGKIHMTSLCHSAVGVLAYYPSRPPLPVAMAPKNYKQPHWFPMVIRNGPAKEGRGVRTIDKHRIERAWQ
jgi:hypothetical protein